MDAVLCCLVVVTAADRAAATCQLSPPYQFISRDPKGWRGRSESHRLVPAGTKSPPPQRRNPPWLLPQKAQSCAKRMTENTPPRRMSAAALSAAVDSLSPQEITHPAWGNKLEGKDKSIPSYSSGVGVWGRGASLKRSGLSPSVSPKTVLRKGVRGRGFLKRSRLPRSSSPPRLFRRSYGKYGRLGIW